MPVNEMDCDVTSNRKKQAKCGQLSAEAVEVVVVVVVVVEVASI